MARAVDDSARADLVGVFGYLAATLASFFIGSDVQGRQDASADKLLESFRTEIGQLRDEIAQLRNGRSTALGLALKTPIEDSPEED